MPKAETETKASRVTRPKKPKADKVEEGDEGSEGEEEEKKKQKKRVKKDPNAPKRAMSAFMFYSMAERENVKESHPHLGFGQIGQQLGEQWRNLSEAEKAPYEQQAEEDKVRAAKDKTAYEKSGGPQRWATELARLAAIQADKDAVLKEKADAKEARAAAKEAKEAKRS